MKNICEATEGCKNQVRYILTDIKRKKTIMLCKEHFENGIEAWFEKDPIIRQLKHEGII